MITVKSRAFFALLLLLCLLFCSCASNLTGLDSLHSLTSPVPSDTEKPTFVSNTVVLPAAAGSDLSERARALTDAIAEQTGLPSTLYFDSEKIPQAKDTHLILLGNTASALSQAHLRDLRRDDYLCRIENGYLILGGKSDRATLLAIDRFSEELLPYADAELLLNKDREFLVRATYPVDALTLNGYSLGDYRIVIPSKAQNGELAVAHALREAIADQCGLYPEILLDADVSERTRIITVGACFGASPASQTAVTADGAQIAINGSTEYALADAAEALYRYLLPHGATGTLSCALTSPILASGQAPTVHAIPSSLATNDLTRLPTLIGAVGSALQAAEIAFAPSDSVSAEIAAYLPNALPATAVHTLSLTDGRVLPLLYTSDTLALLSDSTQGSLSILRFAIRNTDLTFTVCYGYAEDESSRASLWQAALSTYGEDEPLYLVSVSPLALRDSAPDGLPTHAHTVTESAEERISLFLHLPSAMASSAVTAKDHTFILQPRHPFLY